MEDLEIYFDRVKVENQKTEGSFGADWLIYSEENNFPKIQGKDIAIIGVEEDRGTGINTGTAKAPDYIRKQLYKLFPNNFVLKNRLIDLGNIKAGSDINDTYYALSDVISKLIKENIFVIILGGSHDLTYANYMAYEKLEQTVNLVCIDRKFDLGDPTGPVHSEGYLNRIILHQPNFLFNFSNIGLQTYFENSEQIRLMNKMFFDVYRLGEINKQNISETEPVVRNADLLSFDFSAIRKSDAMGTAINSPNGLYGEEACQIMRYAGMSDKLSSIGIYEYNPNHDINNQSAMLIAQMIWCCIDGFYSRKKEFPISNKSEFLKFRVVLEDQSHEIVFYKSQKSDRWWMDVPYPINKSVKYERHHLVPCSYKDYQQACGEDMPEKWWKTYQKLN